MNIRDKTLPELAMFICRIKLARLSVKVGRLAMCLGRAFVTLGERLTPEELRTW